LWFTIRMTVIRPNTPEELDQLLAIQVACIQDLTDTYTPVEMKAWIDYIQKETASRYEAFHNLVYTNDSHKIVGFVSWTDDGTEAKIECLYVLSDYRGKHIGQQLLKVAEGQVKAKKVMIRSTLNARSFYEHNGYIFKSEAMSRSGFKIALLERV